DRAVTGGLGANERPSPANALAREHTGLVAVRDAPTLAEEVTDFAGAYADVARGNIRVVAEVTIRLRHTALAEPHDFGVAEPVRVEIAATLGAAESLIGERVLESLLERQELHDAEVHRRVK